MKPISVTQALTELMRLGTWQDTLYSIEFDSSSSGWSVSAMRRGIRRSSWPGGTSCLKQGTLLCAQEKGTAAAIRTVENFKYPLF